jgi:hypothetical protein
MQRRFLNILVGAAIVLGVVTRQAIGTIVSFVIVAVGVIVELVCALVLRRLKRAI